MKSEQHRILQDLDKHAREFNFPVLDNAYVEFASARLSTFEGEDHWLIVFEVLGFSTREVEFVDDLYAYGPCVEKEGFVAEQIPLTSAQQEPLFDKGTNESVADWSHWSINLRGQTMSFTPSREEYSQAGIAIDRSPGRGTLKEIDLLRFLVFRLGAENLFLNEHALLTHFPDCKGASKFLQTTHWQHPDVADGEKPSENVSMRSLVEALLRRDPNVFNPGRSNTEWKCWATT